MSDIDRALIASKVARLLEAVDSSSGAGEQTDLERLQAKVARMEPVVYAAYLYVLSTQTGTALEACFRRDMLIEAVEAMMANGETLRRTAIHDPDPA